ncbi:hypothetical protein [Halobaculum limi]|uniref:hypothetical protein n=1 Tax=Halobaculum limi TaxID=3031916 RepID=UPI0024073EE1|nr:hypothetical protein [Halobaculum sp. YSMS11]
MSRFHLTTSSHRHTKAKELCNDAGLDVAASLSEDNFHISTYHKRTFENTNFQPLDSTSFIAITGTIIIDGKMGENALDSVYKTYAKSGAKEVRERSFGHYSVVIKDGDHIEIFGDPNGVYEIYYTTEEQWMVSNSLHVCSHSLSSPTVDEYKLLEKSLEVSEITDATPFTEVKRLAGNEIISANLIDGSFSVESLERPTVDWDYSGEQINAIVSDYRDRVKSVFNQITKASSNLGVQATGGLDSRSVLAGLLQQDASPSILYAVGNSPLTNTDDNDLDVAREYAKRFDLEFKKLDWGGNLPTERSGWTSLFEKYGYRYHTYGATENFYNSLSSPAIPELLLSGYAFGTVSNVYYWEQESLVPITLEQIVKEHFSYVQKFSKDQFNKKQEYLDKLVLHCQSALNRLGHDIETDEKMSVCAFARVIQLLNGRPQSAYVNVANEFSFHLSPYATFELSRPMLDFPPEHRRGERIRVKLLNELYSDILNIPIYSGIERAQINNQDELVFPRSGRERLIDFAEQSLPSLLLSTIRPVYRRLNSGPVGTSTYSELVESYQSRLSDSQLYQDEFQLKTYTNDIRVPARIAHYVHGVEQVGYDEIVRY